MPWEDRSSEVMKEQFVKDVLAHKASKAELCREYGISRPTGDKWLKRFTETGSLAELSRAPHSSQNRISAEKEQLIIDIRNMYPMFGAAKLRKILENQGYTDLPSVGTFNNVLRRQHLIDPVASNAAKHIIRFEMAEPNDMWQMDYKGVLKLDDHSRCYPLNILDDCSRYSLCCRAMKTQSYHEIMPVMLELFREYGMPMRIQCDNGNPWGNAAKQSITSFEMRMMEFGILVTHSTIHHPQTQGKTERFNRSFTRERLNNSQFRDITEAQTAFDDYRYLYNNIRPHHALGLATPVSVYHSSTRQMPEKITEWDYPKECFVVKTMPSGFFYFKGQTCFLSTGMGNKRIGIIETDESGKYTLIFRQFYIGQLDLPNRLCGRKNIHLLEGDPREPAPIPASLDRVPEKC